MEKLFATVNAGFPDENGEAQHPGATVVSPYSEQGTSQIAQQGPLAGQLAYAQVNLSGDVDVTESAALGEAISDHAPAVEGLEVLPGGTALAVFETAHDRVHRPRLRHRHAAARLRFGHRDGASPRRRPRLIGRGWA